MAEDIQDTTARAQHNRAWVWLLVVAALAVIAIGIFREMGQWLVVQDSLEPAGAIVVLSGSMPYRAEEAAVLYKHGLAPEVWLTRSDEAQRNLRNLGIEYAGEEIYNRRVLVKMGVPEGAIRILERPVANTEEEILAVSRELQRTGRSSVILVTSPPHTRRVRTLWKKLVGKEPKGMVCHTTAEPYDAGHWWRNTRDCLAVVREMLGLLNAWAGLPVRSAQDTR
jgi:uncharacterized SAM-binding protein YcdF (DUF218 family)